MPYLLLHERDKGLLLLTWLALLGCLSFLYAWGTYDLPQRSLGLRAHRRRAPRTPQWGRSCPTPLDFLVGTMITQPLAWLGLLGAFLVLTELLSGQTSKPRALAFLTLLPWTLLHFIGSRTPTRCPAA